MTQAYLQEEMKNWSSSYYNSAFSKTKTKHYTVLSNRNAKKNIPIEATASLNKIQIKSKSDSERRQNQNPLLCD